MMNLKSIKKYLYWGGVCAVIALFFTTNFAFFELSKPLSKKGMYILMWILLVWGAITTDKFEFLWERLKMNAPKTHKILNSIRRLLDF